MISKTKEIKQFWDSQANTHKSNLAATMPDALLKKLEINAINAELRDPKQVLDIGCGNGYSLFEYAKRNKYSNFIGVDYSKSMINIAKSSLKKQSAHIQRRLNFEVGDATKLRFGKETFDVVMTDRCLINLPTKKTQHNALNEIWRVLKPNGFYVMCEDTQQGLTNLNKLRLKASLPVIPMRWHNLYIDELDFYEYINNHLFRQVSTNNFSSLYYIASRIFNAKLAEIEKKPIDYNHPINQIAASLNVDSYDNYGPLKLFVMQKIDANWRRVDNCYRGVAVGNSSNP